MVLQSLLGEKEANANLQFLKSCLSAKSFASTQGLGRMRHLNVKELWHQAHEKEGRFQFMKIPGIHNVSDVLTMYFDNVSCTRVLGLAGIRVVQLRVPTVLRRRC